MKLYKRAVLNQFLFSIMFFLLMGGINFVLDPLKQYGKNFLDPYFVPSIERYLNPGLVKSYDYNTIIVGSSMTENFLVDYINIKMGVSSLKVSFSGGSAYEHKRIMETAIKTGKVKNIIFGLDIYAFKGDEKRLANGENSMPFHLYDFCYVNDFKYLINYDVMFIENSKAILSNYFGVKSENNNIKKAYYWADDGREFSQRRALMSYNDSGANKNENLKFDIMKVSFDVNLFSLIKDNPKIEFYIFYPPYSILGLKYMKDTGNFSDILKFKQYVYDRLKGYQNVKLYDFQIAEEVTHNLNNYSDMNHYSGDINVWIIDMIVKNHYRVTDTNIEKYIKLFEAQIKNYSVPPLLNNSF